MPELARTEPAALPVGATDKGVGWNGLVALIASEGALFGYLLFSYFYTGASAPPGWLLEPHPSLRLAGPNTVILLVSSVAMWWGERAVKRDRRGAALLGVGLALALGAVFALIQTWEWAAKSYGPGTSSYGSLYFLITGFHIAHVLAGLATMALLLLWIARGHFGPTRHLAVTIGSWYWHFVDAVWLAVFATFYLTPYLGFAR